MRAPVGEVGGHHSTASESFQVAGDVGPGGSGREAAWSRPRGPPGSPIRRTAAGRGERVDRVASWRPQPSRVHPDSGGTVPRRSPGAAVEIERTGWSGVRHLFTDGAAPLPATRARRLAPTCLRTPLAGHPVHLVAKLGAGPHVFRAAMRGTRRAAVGPRSSAIAVTGRRLHACDGGDPAGVASRSSISALTACAPSPPAVVNSSSSRLTSDPPAYDP